MGIWIDSMSLLLWIMLQWTYTCMYLYIPLSVYPVMTLLGQMVFLLLVLWGIATLSSTMVELIYIPTNSVKTFLFLHSLASILFLDILIITTLTGMRWYLIVVLICISLMISNVEIFFIWFQGHLYVFFWKVSVHILCLLFGGVVWFFLVNLFKFFVDSGY